MKKIMLVMIVLLLACAPAMAEVDFDFSTGLYADPAAPTTAGNSGPAQIVKPSNNVYGSILAAPNAFAAVTLHVNGTYEYGTSSEDTKIYRNTRTETYVGTTTFDTDTLSASDTTDFVGWAAL